MQNKLHLIVLSVLLLGGISVCGYAQCGSERTSVKSLSDPGASKIDFSRIEPATVAELVAIPEQKGDVPRRDIETHLVKVHATLYRYGLEGDGDYHLCIKDESGKTMIVEVPNPKCPEAAKSGHAKEYAAFRNAVDQSLGKCTKKFKVCNAEVWIIGVICFDTHIHGQTGHADDDVELHPGLLITFLKIISKGK